MRRYVLIVLTLLLLAFLFTGVKRLLSQLALERDKSLQVLLVYDKDTYQVRAFRSVLEEEGVPHRLVHINTLISTDPKTLSKTKPALLLPDGSLQYIHPDTMSWFKKYLSTGGSVFVSYDAGTKNYAGAYLKEALFTNLLGANYVLYDKLRGEAYSKGYLKITDRSLEITPGKVDREERLITGYIYGSLEYPYAKVEMRNFTDRLLAVVIDSRENKEYPGMFWERYEKGYIFYSAVPLGHLKAYSDDLVLRATLRYFLFKLLKLPHLVNTPKGKGGLVINWHIDASIDWKSIPMMLKEGYLRNGIEYSSHITAGPFRDQSGDGLGFDACGKGREYVKMLIPYGVIGSHGGWAHNWFSENVLKGKFKEKEIYQYIKKNNDCLVSITGYKIREYSAPNGVHPQPQTTEVLEKLGMVAYYYTGDSGSSPNRTFINGKMVSSKVIAFPITPFEKATSLYEMKKQGVSEEDVAMFLISLAEYVEKTRQIRLFYSHPYDIPLYPNAILKFLDLVEEKEKSKKIEVHAMSYFAEFLLRFLKTDYSFRKEGDVLKVKLKNPEGLKDISIAIPRYYGKVLSFPKEAVFISQDEDYYYFYLADNPKEVDFSFKFH